MQPGRLSAGLWWGCYEVNDILVSW